ncbi:single-stranded DNA-binding protein [Pedobacter aquatilis]|uniref:single-stranded DNA-binding protein n=1 Tax=Pedobacter aquatilis TaxID=351343 RepID=UPI00292DD646|nr:single-stranded DNA-binding protein [Pedobacter aquatilis]
MENVTNRVTLSGFAGADAEIKKLSEKQKLAKVRLAVNEYYKNGSGEEVKTTQWFNLTFWNAKADFAEKHIIKGTYLSIEGRLVNNFYESKDGSKRYSMEIFVNEIHLKEPESVD